jgi:hypothetical protein
MFGASVIACACKPASTPISKIDDMKPEVVERCIQKAELRDVYRCLLGVVPSWQIDVTADELVDGPLNPNPPLAPQAIAVLQAIVDECQIGETYLQSGYDFKGTLLITHANLTSGQIKCIRSKERPGLRLAKVDY